MTYRTGNCWTGQTIILEGTQPTDAHGRRPDDRLVANVDTGAPEGLAGRICAGLNLAEVLKRFEVEALGDYLGEGRIWLRCDRCHAWAADISGPLSLAELVQRADEHAEVCP